jgi:hypothetical protein
MRNARAQCNGQADELEQRHTQTNLAAELSRTHAPEPRTNVWRLLAVVFGAMSVLQMTSNFRPREVAVDSRELVSTHLVWLRVALHVYTL